MVFHTLHLFYIDITPSDFSLEHSLVRQSREEHIQSTHSDPAPKAGRKVWEPLSMCGELSESSDSESIDGNFSMLLSQNPNTLLKQTLQKAEVMRVALTQMNPLSKHPLT